MQTKKRHLLTSILSLLIVSCLTINNTIAETITQKSLKETITPDQKISINPSAEIPDQLKENIKSSLTKIYGENQVDEIYPKVLEIINNAKDKRPVKLHQNDINRISDWYKDEIVYMFYTEHFGRTNNKPSTFNDLVEMLDYLEELGITTIYMLPFMDSPMGDAGFDVRDPNNVREELGGMEEFRNFIYQARKRGFKIKADLILNHFSDQHKWFQEALAGDLDKLNYFVYREDRPEYKKYRDEQKGIIVDYYEDDGKVSSRRLIFPDIAESHYRKIMIGDKDYYVYHTFYPFQPDINWKNPEVMYEVLKIVAFWNNLGVDIFRVDAIPYFIKKEGTNAENLPETHEVVKLISSTLQATGPRSIMLAEACQWPEDILPYFGTENTLPPRNIQIQYGEDNSILVQPDRKLVRTDEVQIGYHFPYMPAIWASLITENNEPFWKADEITPEIPPSATWAMFLRVHDELTLEMVDIETRKIIYDKLISKGKEFRKGLGVSGRMADFLDKDPSRITLAYSILLSLPGMPIIYYGDEIGAQNNLKYAEMAAEERERVQREKDKDIEVISFYDSRDINRGPIEKDEFYKVLEEKDTYNAKIFYTVKDMIKARKDNIALRRGSFNKVESDKPEILSYIRVKDDDKVLVINNLSDQKLEACFNVSPDNLKNLKKNNNKAIDLITKEQIGITSDQNSLKIMLKPYQKMWLKI